MCRREIRNLRESLEKSGVGYSRAYCLLRSRLREVEARDNISPRPVRRGDRFLTGEVRTPSDDLITPSVPEESEAVIRQVRFDVAEGAVVFRTDRIFPTAREQTLFKKLPNELEHVVVADSAAIFFFNAAAIWQRVVFQKGKERDDADSARCSILKEWQFVAERVQSRCIVKAGTV